MERVTDDAALRVADLRASAKGWHGVQLGVLGFIGLCGVLQDAASAPRWIQVLAGLLVLAALALACLATALVAMVAWPVYRPSDPAEPTGVDPELVARRLRRGISLTFVAVVVLAVAATSSWWPEPSAGGTGGSAVEVTTQQGSACGDLRAGTDGALTLETAEGAVSVPVDQVVSVRPVASC